MLLVQLMINFSKCRYLCGLDCMFFELVFVFEFILWFLFVASVFISISSWFWCWAKHLHMINVMITGTTFYQLNDVFSHLYVIISGFFFHETLIVLLLWKNFVIIIFKFSSFCDFCEELWSKQCVIVWISKKNTKSPNTSCQKNCSQKSNYTTYK